jgi:hypothetical protein
MGVLKMDYLGWAKALGIPALAAAIAFGSWWSTRSSNRWQVKIAREKLKHDLYDRRFAIYMAFHDLMVAVAEKSDIDAELRKANAARAHSPLCLPKISSGSNSHKINNIQVDLLGRVAYEERHEQSVDTSGNTLCCARLSFHL